MRMEVFEVGPLPTNCYFLINEETKETLIVDPGDMPDALLKWIKEEGLLPVGILITHGHYDHIDGVPALKRAYPDIPIYAHAEEAVVLSDIEANHSRFLHPGGTSITEYNKLQDGDELDLIGEKIRILYLPGHSIGGCAYYFADHKALFIGDTIFYHDVGRTDLPTGSTEDLMRSIREKVFTLPDDVVLYTGHGEFTTVKEERENNPYFR